MDSTASVDRPSSKPLTLAEIVLIQPGVGPLLERASRERLCCGWYRSGGIKTQIEGLVGWRARDLRDPRLGSAEAYEAVYFAALERLQDDACPRCDEGKPEDGELWEEVAS